MLTFFTIGQFEKLLGKVASSKLRNILCLAFTKVDFQLCNCNTICKIRNDVHI